MNTAASTHPLLTTAGKLPEAKRLARAVRSGLVDRDELDRLACRLAEDTARPLKALGHRRADRVRSGPAVHPKNSPPAPLGD